MATNCVRHPADIVPFTAPTGGVVSGVPVMVGSFFVVPSVDAEEGESFEGQLTGEWNLPKVAADVVTEGAAAYFDGTNVTTDATDNKLIGAFTEARDNGDTEAHVRLNGIATV